MMSKSSLWGSITENNKRRLWIWAVSWIIWLFTYPVGMLVLCSRRQTYITADGNEKTEMIRTVMTGVAKEWLSFNEFTIIITIILAVVVSIQGFSYLYSKKKMDFYKSMPVKEAKRFTVITVNGFLIFFIPYCVSLIAGIAVAAANGAKVNVIIGEILICAGELVILYLGIFGLTALAVMLTGQLIITLFAVGIFMIYELIITALIQNLKWEYFAYYSGIGERSVLYSQPIYWFISLYDEPAVYKLLFLVGISALFLLLAYFCFRKRPAEAAGRAMAFPVSKPIVKFLLVIPAVLGAGGIMGDMLGDTRRGNTIALQIFIMVIVLVISSGLIEVIYEMDIKAALHKKRQILWAGLCSGLLFCIFFFDLFGYDSWIPKQDQLSSGIVFFNEVTNENGYWTEDYKRSINSYDYYMDLEGVADPEAILELSKQKLLKKDEEPKHYINLGYRMKSGKVVWRNFPVGAGAEDALNRITETQEFKEQVFQIYNDKLFENIKVNAKVAYNKGISIDNLPAEDLDEIRALLLKDMESLNYSTMYHDNIIGRLEIETPVKRNRGNGEYRELSTFLLNIYPSYQGVIRYLADRGIYMDGYVRPEDVLSITVTNAHNELYELNADTEKFMEQTQPAQYDVTVTYDDPEQIKEILKCVYPGNFPSIRYDNKFHENYSAEIIIKKNVGSSSYYRGYSSFTLMSDTMPAFLEQDTAYK